ncbi:MAG: GNAT family N-acetyltransferase [Actinomycetota bacterium]|nr:GNAT family N-acetyltransferase [Actinomycetota bacterium]
MSSDEPVTLRRHDESAHAEALIDELVPVYADVYAEPPYLEGPEDVTDFTDTFQTRRLTQTGFRLVTAHTSELIGFTFGHTLRPGTGWWRGALTSLPDEFTAEPPGRTFAIIELAVRAPWRRRGVAGMLHDALLEDRPEERATLLVRPEATPAQAAYARWGWRKVGQIRRVPTAPVYDALVLTLRARDRAASDRR